MYELLKLFCTFFRIGLMSFGGGYSMLPMLERELVIRHRWVTRQDILDYFAIGQCAPGVIAVNTATLVGYALRGLPGALFAAVGIISPSFIILVAIASVLDSFMDIPAVTHAFAGIRIAVAALIISAVTPLFKSNVITKGRDKNVVNIVSFIMFVFAFLIAASGFSPTYVIVAAAVTGLIFFRKRGES